MLRRPDGEPAVAVERDLPEREVVDEAVQQRHHVAGREEGQQAVGDDDRGTVGRHDFQPGGVGEVRGHGMGPGPVRDEFLPGRDDSAEVDVVPVDGRRCADPEDPGVQPGAEVEPDRAGMPAEETLRDLIELLRAMGDVEDRAGAEAEPAAVIAEAGDDPRGDRVAEDRSRQAAVQSPAAQREEQRVLDRRERRQGDVHDGRSRSGTGDPAQTLGAPRPGSHLSGDWGLGGDR
jgi:hypothetical protein